MLIIQFLTRPKKRSETSQSLPMGLMGHRRSLWNVEDMPEMSLHICLRTFQLWESSKNSVWGSFLISALSLQKVTSLTVELTRKYTDWLWFNKESKEISNLEFFNPSKWVWYSLLRRGTWASRNCQRCAALKMFVILCPCQAARRLWLRLHFKFDKENIQVVHYCNISFSSIIFQ